MGVALRGLCRVLDYVGIGEERYREVQTYSTGMRQKQKLTQAIVQEEIIDEVTSIDLGFTELFPTAPLTRTSGIRTCAKRFSGRDKSDNEFARTMEAGRASARAAAGSRSSSACQNAGHRSRKAEARWIG